MLLHSLLIAQKSDILNVLLQAGQEILDPETTELWWAGKEFLRHQVRIHAHTSMYPTCHISILSLYSLYR